MLRIYELLDGKFRDISPVQGYQTEAAAFAAARGGYREHLLIIVRDSYLIGALYAGKESTGSATFES